MHQTAEEGQKMLILEWAGCVMGANFSREEVR